MSIERINNDESNQVIIDKLKAIIEIESAKPISEQDMTSLMSASIISWN